MTPRSKSELPFLAFLFFLLVPSTELAQKYFGNAGIAVYLAFASFAVFILRKYFLSRRLSTITRSQFMMFAIATFALVVLLFIILFPLAEKGFILFGTTIGGRGDRDNALNSCVMKLLAGEYPYRELTYLGNPISPLPGSIFLALPFVVLFGTCAVQNLVWIAMTFFIVAKYVLRDRIASLVFFWIVLLFSPVVLQELVTGSDYVSNVLFVFVFILLAWEYIPRGDVQAWKKILVAAALGVTLSSRAHFLLLVPMLFSALGQRAGWNEAMKYIGISVLVFAAVTLPFYFADPGGFSPITTFRKITSFENILPHAGMIVGLISAAIAAVLAVRTTSDHKIFLRNCALTQLLPVVAAVTLASLDRGTFSLKYFGGYGLAFLFFGTLAYWEEFLQVKSKR